MEFYCTAVTDWTIDCFNFIVNIDKPFPKCTNLSSFLIISLYISFSV